MMMNDTELSLQKQPNGNAKILMTKANPDEPDIAATTTTTTQAKSASLLNNDQNYIQKQFLFS